MAAIKGEASIGKAMEMTEPLCCTHRNLILCSHYGKECDVTHKTEYRVAQKNQSQKVEVAQIPIDILLNLENMLYPHTTDCLLTFKVTQNPDTCSNKDKL